MGNTSSSLSDLSKEDVARAVASHGAKFEVYANAVRDNGIDGEILADLQDDELCGIFDELGITSKLHRKVLSKAFAKARQQGNASPAEPEPAARDHPEYFRAAASFGLNIETPDSELQDFDCIAREVLQENKNATFAGVNLILEDAQHPIAARLRKPDGSLESARKLANLPIKDSVCYYLTHDPSRDYLVKELPVGNAFGEKYVGYVIKDESGDRLGAVCQVTKIKNKQDEQEQINLLKRLAQIVEEQLRERRSLQCRAQLLKEQLASMRVE